MSISLEELIGTEIVAKVPAFDKTKWVRLKLHNVEASGLWVESKEIQDAAIKDAAVTFAPRTAVFFLPFAQIVFVVSSLDMAYVPDEALK